MNLSPLFNESSTTDGYLLRFVRWLPWLEIREKPRLGSVRLGGFIIARLQRFR